MCSPRAFTRCSRCHLAGLVSGPSDKPDPVWSVSHRQVELMDGGWHVSVPPSHSPFVLFRELGLHFEAGPPWRACRYSSFLGKGRVPGGRAGLLRHVKQVPFTQFLVHPTSHVPLCGGVRLQRWNRLPEGGSVTSRGQGLAVVPTQTVDSQRN